MQPAPFWPPWREEYRRYEVIAVRAVGTAALRDASNRDEFLERASSVLGTRVEVISGLEEARLIHLGVANAWPNAGHRVMITDIGGGSTELIISEGNRIVEAYSKPLGAVRLTELFLKSDPPDPREIERMRRYIQERIAGAAARFSASKIDRMIATSATAAATVCAVNRVGAPSATKPTGVPPPRRRFANCCAIFPRRTWQAGNA